MLFRDLILIREDAFLDRNEMKRTETEAEKETETGEEELVLLYW